MKAMNNRQTKKIGEDRYRFMNSCFLLPQGSVTVNRGYSEGLGQTEYFRGDSDAQEFNKLVYFKKGTETWGNAVGTECSPILATPSPSANEQTVKIIPNPMKNKATIVIDGIKQGDDNTFILYTLVGQEIMSMQLTNTSTVLERNNLPAGMYIWVLKGKNQKVTGKLMMN
jgi:hypothetical protein